jgi:WD40 repeat protein
LTLATDNRFKLWDLQNSNQLGFQTLKKNQLITSSHLTRPSVSELNELLICGSSNGKLKLWELFENQSYAGSNGNAYHSIDVSKFGLSVCAFDANQQTQLAVGDLSGNVFLLKAQED